ncbi:MAG TPA: universal stress protein [Solirubrobacteraceae bacterium]|jgi:nucleotide-binding universal stress UspA family protein|nr:universal stress protein [Solirubrobacteraceae bacterium]
MTKRIIVAAFGDGDASRDAVAFAIELARADQAELLLAGIWASPLGAGDSLYEGVVRGEIERELEVLRELVPQDVHVHIEVRGATSVVRGLHRLVAGNHHDVLVFSAADLTRHGHGNLALEAIHDAPCAVAVAPNGYAREREQLGPDVATAWVDTPEAQAALEAAVGYAQHTGGTLRIVQVLAMPYRFSDQPWVDASGVQHWLESARPEAEASLQLAVERVAERVPVLTDLRDGYSGHELAEASRGCAMIVTGSRGYGALRRLVLGSTTADLLREATVPVVTLPRAVAERDAGDAQAAFTSSA